MEWKKWIDGGMAQWNEVNGLLSPDRVEGSGVASGRRLSHAAAGWGCERVIAEGGGLPGRTRGPSRQACEKTGTARSILVLRDGQMVDEQRVVLVAVVVRSALRSVRLFCSG